MSPFGQDPTIVGDFPFAVTVTDHSWVPLADGTRLSIKTWMPVGAPGETFPVVLEAIPYRKGDVTAVDDAVRFGYIAGHGYVCVRLDLRGSGESEGVLDDEYSPREQRDIAEVIQWLADQPWSTGSVGMTGISWSGFNSLQVAAHRPPALKAIITVCSTDDRYDNDVHYMGGSVLGFYMNWWGTIMHGFNVRPPDPAVVGPEWETMWKERLADNPYLSEVWLSHQRRDDYWKQGSVSEDYAAITVPVLAVGGWADAYTDAIFRLMDGLPGVHKALVGPWGHTWPERAIPGPIIGFLQENLRWWDRWLKGIDTGVENDPTVRYWLQDTATMKPDLDLRPGRWIQADAFPTIESHGARHFALDAGGVLGPVAAEPGSAPGHESADIVAPLTVSHRSELTVGQQAGHWLPMGSPLDLPREQSIDDEGSLVFDTAPLRNPLHVVGQPVLKLRVAADKPLAFVFVRLSEVTPDGTVNLITRANLNLAHRDSHEFPEPLVPGQFYPVSIALKNVAQTLPAGHRLRIALSTNYWPWIWPTAEQAEITVALGESYLEFPLVDEDRLEPMTASFGRAEIAEPIEVVDTGIHRPYWKRTHDDATGVSVMARSSDGTGVKRTPNGLTFSGKDETRYIITDGDPLSAVMECDRFFLFEREDWSVRVEMNSRMSSTATDFVVETRLRAFTAGVCVHEEDRTTAIPRDLN